MSFSEKYKQIDEENFNVNYWKRFRMLIKHQSLVYLCLCLLFTLASCKKNQLKGDKEKLIGNWKRILIIDSTNPIPIIPTYDSDAINLIITKDGKYEIKKSNKLIEKGRIYLKPYTETNYWDYSITFDKKAAPLPMAKPRFDSHSLIKLKNKDTLTLTENQGYSYQNIHTFVLQ